MCRTSGEGWQQTSTVEGTKVIDAWVKAGEPRHFTEFGLGGAGFHAYFGFVRPFNNLADLTPNDNKTITGRVVNLRLSRPPTYEFSVGAPVENCWVGLNDSLALGGFYVGSCNSDGSGEFAIPGVPAGSYQLVVFDSYLDYIVNIQQITVPEGNAGGSIPVGSGTINGDAGFIGEDGDVASFRWFGTEEHYVFADDNSNGMWDEGESPLPEQAINFRFRDGTIYHANATDFGGAYPFEEQFPFFSWLVAEVDFARFKATGVTIAVDAGGPVEGTIGGGVFNPQYQDPLDGGTNCVAEGCLTRTELGTVLTEGYQSFLGMTNVFEWGKRPYSAEMDNTPAGNFPGPEDIDANQNGILEPEVFENGGLSGVVFYAVTRAENDPRFAAAEEWEPGIPRVQLNLYRSDEFGNIDETVNGMGGVQLADVDNYPFGWQDGTAPMGPEDVNQDGVGPFDSGDAIEIAHSDSWDDNVPTGCPAGNYHPSGDPTSDPLYLDGRCYDGQRNYNQVRPALFDGGFGFGIPFTDLYLDPGFYVIEAKTPPGYLHLKEQDKNVDFGDTFTINPLALPASCVGEPNVLPAELELFPGVDTEGFPGSRPLCDRKVVEVADGRNMAADFFMFTEAPVTGHIRGIVLNDLANEFDPANPNYGEKFAPAFVPVSFRDFASNEVYYTTTDQFGIYHGIVPSTYTINIPMASGVSPNMLQVCLNSPTREDPTSPGTLIPDPNFNKLYGQFCYSFNFAPGTTTYLDTPLLPIGAFVGPGNWQLDGELPDLTPVIHSVTTTTYSGPVVGAALADDIIITSVGNINGNVDVPDPNFPQTETNDAVMITRNHGFGSVEGEVWIGDLQVPPADVDWSLGTIVVTEVPAAAETGQLTIVRGDSGKSTVNSVTLIVLSGTDSVMSVTPGGSIQDVIDLADDGEIIVIPPGTYYEPLIITRPVQLAGAGAGSTIINAGHTTTNLLSLWRIKVNEMRNCPPYSLGLLPGQLNNTVNASAPCGHIPGTGLLPLSEAAGVSRRATRWRVRAYREGAYRWLDNYWCHSFGWRRCERLCRSARSQQPPYREQPIRDVAQLAFASATRRSDRSSSATPGPTPATISSTYTTISSLTTAVCPSPEPVLASTRAAIAIG